jgi:hypothetical protein
LELFKPRGASNVRSPVTDKQQNGQVVNTPRFDQLGGLSNPSKIGSKNQFTIKPPGDGKKVI